MIQKVFLIATDLNNLLASTVTRVHWIRSPWKSLCIVTQLHFQATYALKIINRYLDLWAVWFLVFKLKFKNFFIDGLENLNLRGVRV